MAMADTDTKIQQGQRIQTISDRVWNIYEQIREVSNLTVNAKLAVKKATKVNVEAIKTNLNGFKELCVDAQLKESISGICHDLDYMPFDGTTQLFIAHNVKQTTSNKIEFVCCAVRKYEYPEQYVCDYCLSTFTYSKFIDYGGVVAGAGIGAAGVIIGTISIGSAFVTGGVSLAILGAIGGITGLGATAFGGAILSAAMDTDIEERFKEILEASFLYELVQRGHAVIHDRILFITHD
ncbi:unnamed protein product [Adineta steineri]|uniref:Uncharacterized protein n=1 Tax=Adineta steineri TaxID=433720 RepID=A0A814J9I3_9BILA|nr:unnamed protein product [Adineta steineri]CAF4038187.1 unnamed protein product [Adineta steineri]